MSNQLTFLLVVTLVLATVALLPSSASPQSADLSVLKTADPEPVAAGGTLTFTLTVSNEGPNDAANVQLSDLLPSGLTFQSLVSPGGWSC